MNSYLKTFLIVLGVIASIVILYYIITIIIDIIKIKKSLQYALYNNIKCGQELCPGIVETLSLPTNINMKDLRLDVIKYSASLIYALESSAKDNTPLVLQPDVTLIKELKENEYEPAIGLILSSNDNSNTLWIVFRGTQTTDEWKKDLELQQESFLSSKSTQQIRQSFLVNESGQQPNIHKGFADVYQNIRYQLLDTIGMYNYETIIITGHSLGAALSTIAGIDLYQRGHQNIVFNFACPRVGDKVFADMVDSSVKVYRVVNTADIVPTLPLASQPNYNNPKNPISYAHCGQMISFENNWFSIMNNHLMPNYMEWLSTLNI